jgi:hypothetical protein
MFAVNLPLFIADQAIMQGFAIKIRAGNKNQRKRLHLKRGRDTQQ